jgi:lipid A 3-O-deacylase
MSQGFCMRFLAILTLSATGPLLAAATALAADVAAPAYPRESAVYAPPILSEMRLGFSAQDPSGPEKGSYNFTGEVLTSKFWRTNDWTDVFIPRLHAGGSVNFRGDTSFAYAGFTWTFDITPKFFVEGSFGGAVHNGDTSVTGRPDHNALGCSPLFRESASVGLRFDERWSLIGTVEHMSNAGLCSQNRGLTNIGVRLGYSF